MTRCLALVVAAALGCTQSAVAADLRAQLDALVAAYPDALARHDGASVYWRDGSVALVGSADTRKSLRERLTQASIADQFYLPYPKGRLDRPPAVDADPGRFRNEAFFDKLYGDCRRDGIERQLTDVSWFGRTIKVMRRHGAADQLRKVAADLAQLPESLRRAAYPTAGVYNCRPVQDTGKLSMHAYAAAVDLNPEFADYWLWRRGSRADAVAYKNRMPYEIVDAFERHGFIWGGKWYHYDTMHFEYRPELLKP
jgi:hypothetical protein